MATTRTNTVATLVSSQEVLAEATWESDALTPAAGEMRLGCELLVTVTYAGAPGGNQRIIVGYRGHDGTNDYEDSPPSVPRTVTAAATYRFAVMFGDVAAAHKWFVTNDTAATATVTVILRYCAEVVA